MTKKLGSPIFNGRLYRGFNITEVRTLNDGESFESALTKAPEAYKISKDRRSGNCTYFGKFSTFEECISWIDEKFCQ